MRTKISGAFPCLMILVCLYGNLNVLIKNCTRFKSTVQGQISPLPAPDSLFIVFDFVGAFREQTTTNSGYFAYGLTERTKTPPMVPSAQLVEIDLYEMLNLPAMEVKHNWAEGGFAKRAAPEIKREMANRVQAYYHRNNPDKKLQQVWVFRAFWPAHDYHYKGNFNQAKFVPWAHN